jgi:transcriptional regulator with XRE-family HTH domain
LVKLSKGRKLKVKRTAMGKTLEQLTPVAGVSIGFLSLLECGKRFCSKRQAPKLAKAYGVKISDIPTKQ